MVWVRNCSFTGLLPSSGNLNQCWPRLMMPTGITGPQWVKSNHCNSFENRIPDLQMSCSDFDKISSPSDFNHAKCPIEKWLHTYLINTLYMLDALLGHWCPDKMKEYFSILMQISLKFFPSGSIDTGCTLVQAMTRYRTGEKSLPNPVTTRFTNVYLIVNSLAIGKFDSFKSIFKTHFTEYVVAWILTGKRPSIECHRMPPMAHQHWFRQWLGVVRRQDIIWANVDPVLRCDIASLGHSGLTYRCKPANSSYIQTYCQQ